MQSLWCCYCCRCCSSSLLFLCNCFEWIPFLFSFFQYSFYFLPKCDENANYEQPVWPFVVAVRTEEEKEVKLKEICLQKMPNVPKFNFPMIWNNWSCGKCCSQAIIFCWQHFKMHFVRDFSRGWGIMWEGGGGNIISWKFRKNRIFKVDYVINMQGIYSIADWLFNWLKIKWNDFKLFINYISKEIVLFISKNVVITKAKKYILM